MCLLFAYFKNGKLVFLQRTIIKQLNTLAYLSNIDFGGKWLDFPLQEVEYDNIKITAV
jgi:hypothetical protein